MKETRVFLAALMIMSLLAGTLPAQDPPGREQSDIESTLAWLEGFGKSNVMGADVDITRNGDRIVGVAINVRVSQYDMMVVDNIQHNLARVTCFKHLQNLAVDVPIKDLSFVAKLPNLRLFHAGLAMDDISPLAQARDLEDVQLFRNVTDISPLAHLPKIKRIAISHSPLKDLSPLANLTTLESLFLHDLKVVDLSPLKDLVNLRKLYFKSFRHDKPLDIAPLANLSKLESLDLTAIEDPSPLTGLKRLEHLTLRCAHKDITALASLVNLKELELSGLFDDISALGTLTQLEKLRLSSPELRDVSPLASLASLTDLSLTGSSSVSDLAPLSRLNRLEHLHLGDNFTAEAVSELRKSLPNCHIHP